MPTCRPPAGAGGADRLGFHHPVVGELVLADEELALTAEPEQVVLISTAEPGSPSAQRLRLLGSWAAESPGPVEDGARGR
jgi:hypothetical protein